MQSKIRRIGSKTTLTTSAFLLDAFNFALDSALKPIISYILFIKL